VGSNALYSTGEVLGNVRRHAAKKNRALQCSRMLRHVAQYTSAKSICTLLGYNAASSGNTLPTFRDNGFLFSGFFTVKYGGRYVVPKRR
jgi:hypothetical protein